MTMMVRRCTRKGPGKWLLIATYMFVTLKIVFIVLPIDFIPYLLFDNNFTYPLDIDMHKLIKQIKNNDPIVKSINVINPHPFRYTFNPNVCSKNFGINTRNFSLLVLVKSAASYFKKRRIIRRTWGKQCKSDSIRMVFLLGFSGPDQNVIEKESSLYGDIVQENFVEAYRNNTYKTIMGFNWAVQNCKNAKYLLFVDDDYLLNITNVVNYLLKDGHDNLLTGEVFPRSMPFRKHDHKWYVSYEEYLHPKWPPYMTGGGVLVSKKIAEMFCYVFPYVKYLFMDDCFVGITAFKLDIRPTHTSKFKMYGCDANFYKYGFGCQHENSDNMLSMWKELQNNK